ncbi:MAG TPA: hypothetical protein VGQ76_20145 [Thermoanaerobaculia bacterium]|jgi:hypothetical protein|nr:hypothetical protein [Thermoanaerobaculia bacterium]
MKVRELKAALAEANDDADVIVEKHATHTGANVTTFDPHAYEVTAVSIVETSGKVRIEYDESKTTRID